MEARASIIAIRTLHKVQLLPRAFFVSQSIGKGSKGFCTIAMRLRRSFRGVWNLLSHCCIFMSFYPIHIGLVFEVWNKIQAPKLTQ